MFYKFKYTLFVISCLLCLSCCQTRWVTTCPRKPKLSREERKAQREERREKEEYYKQRQIDAEKAYSKQPRTSKNTWDTNKNRSEAWLEKSFPEKTFKEKVIQFFHRFKREPKPNNGLASRREIKKRKRRNKNIFRRIFKRNKKRRKNGSR
ncbi:MAG: hypothetical protein MI739_14060 [Bacteroidales bacterium]|nr:hypothetical protein [Bacteroidales bacterium]